MVKLLKKCYNFFYHVGILLLFSLSCDSGKFNFSLSLKDEGKREIKYMYVHVKCS